MFAIVGQSSGWSDNRCRRQYYPMYLPLSVSLKFQIFRHLDSWAEIRMLSRRKGLKTKPSIMVKALCWSLGFCQCQRSWIAMSYRGHAVQKTVEHVKRYKAPKQSTIDWVALSIISDRNRGRMNLEIEMVGWAAFIRLVTARIRPSLKGARQIL